MAPNGPRYLQYAAKLTQHSPKMGLYWAALAAPGFGRFWVVGPPGASSCIPALLPATLPPAGCSRGVPKGLSGSGAGSQGFHGGSMGAPRGLPGTPGAKPSSQGLQGAPKGFPGGSQGFPGNLPWPSMAP